MRSNNDLQIELEKTLQQLVREGKEETAVAAIRPIILTNLEQKRICHWLGTDNNRTLKDYVHLVLETYARYSHYIYRLQVEKAETVWGDLYLQLQQWAYNYLSKKGFYHSQATVQLAADYATEAAITLLTARFPYDRNFIPWSRVLLLNICKREMRQAKKAGRLPDEKQIALDDELIYLHNALFSIDNRPQELRRALLDAIEQLPQESWRQTLLLRYFDNLTPAEIACEMGKTPAAVYNLHFKAITALREIWGVNVYID